MYNNFFLTKPRKVYLAVRSAAVWSWRLGSMGKLSVIGKVKIMAPQKLTVGGRCFIDDFVVINASGSADSSIKLGAKTVIREYCVLEAHKGQITLEDEVFLGQGCMLYGQGGLHIGAKTMVAAGSLFIPSNHNISWADVPYREQGETSKGIKIGRNCWIGAKVTVLDGVELGDNTVVAAGAVVTRAFGPDLLLAGIPAKPIKTFDQTKSEWVRIA